MRHLLFLILVLILPALATALPAQAQIPTSPNDSSLFVVTDVATDVTADSAAHARDKAIMQAQRSAFEQLLDRLGADKNIATKLSDDDLATLVQNFEVQNERSSSVRYLGTFTVQFRPNPVRKLLGNKNIKFTEARSRPMLVLPIYQAKDHPVLWEETTRWRLAWDSATHGDSNLVPVTLPSGGLDDISTITAEEAMSGKTEALHNAVDKYHTGGVTVAVLHGDPTVLSSPMTVDVQGYNEDGEATETSHLTVPPAPSKVMIDDTLTQAVRQVRNQMDKNWRQSVKDSTLKADDTQSTVVIDPAVAAAPVMELPVLLPISKLSDLAQAKQTLATIPGLSQVDVISLARGAANIQIGYHGSVAELMTALRARNLTLNQDPLSGTWTLRSAVQSY